MPENQRNNPRYPKYPRTPHLPWSPGKTDDDKVITKKGLLHLQSGIPLVTTVKMDGGNVTLTPDRFYGRSVDATGNPWDEPAKARWGEIRYDIPAGWRISAESMWARRSVAYDNLADYLLVFGIWNEHNELLRWSETEEWSKLLGLTTVPVIYRGNSFEEAAAAWAEKYTTQFSEGFVIRNAERFAYKDFATNCLKWVRKGHIQTSDDWRHRDDFERNTFMRRVSE